MFFELWDSEIFEVSHKQVINPQPAAYANHMHTYCEIILFLSGDVDYNIDGNFYKPKPYDIMFIPKDTYHYLMPTCETVYENYVLSFSHTLISGELYDKIFTYPYIANVKGNDLAVSFFNKLDLYKSIFSPEDFKLSVSSLLRELLVYCAYIDKAGSISAVENDPLISTVIAYISENLTNPITVHTIAAHVKLSVSHIQNSFSKKMNIGIKQYILQRKVFAARNAIEGGARPSEVYLEFGFGDYSSFYRAHKHILGYPPNGHRSGGKKSSNV